MKGLARFRGNCFLQRGAVSAVFRQIPYEILGFRELGVPSVVEGLCNKPRGLVLVTGPTGSGKSTTLATMLDKINREHPKQPGVPREFAGGRLVRDDVVEGHHWTRDQVPVFGQAHWHDRLEVPVVVPLAVVQLEVVELIRDGPEAAHRVGELPVQLARVRFCSDDSVTAPSQ